MIRKPALLVLTCFLLAFCSALGWGWLRQTPSFEEMYGSAVRGMDFFWAARSVGGWPWWTPNYLFGHSYALFSLNLLPLTVLAGLAWALGPWAPAFVAFKVFGLLTVFFAGLAAYALSRRLLLGTWSAALTAVLYVTCSQFVLHIAMLEHLTTAACMIFAPLILLGIVRCEDRLSWRSALLLALSVSAMAMCYFKIFLLFLPAGGLFLFWRVFSAAPDPRKALLRGCLRGALLTVPLALFPMVHVLRETRFLALFELEPFAAWQQNYSFFSAITWIDWGNFLTRGTAIPALSATQHSSVEFYLGAVVLAGIFLPLFLGRTRPGWSCLPAWNVLRGFGALLVLATWLASGPRSIIGSLFAYLSGAAGCPDFSIPFVWGMFIAQGLLIYLLWGPGNIRLVLALFTIALFYFVPGFRLLELLPIYRDIRAPSTVWTAFGSLSAVLAAGAGWSLLARIPLVWWQRVAALAATLVLLALDVSFLHAAFFRPGLPGKTFSDYGAAQAFLSNAPLAGRVHAISGRYFYLTTPRDSGRALASEALLRHFQLRWIRYMEAGSLLSPELTKAYFDLFGISYVLIDRLDPDTPKDYQDKFKKIFPVVFENEGFAILENASSLYPAYAARDIVGAGAEIFMNPGAVLLLGRGGLIAAEGVEEPVVGHLDVQGEPAIPGRAELEKTAKLEKLTLASRQTENEHSFKVVGLEAKETPGILVVTEAYHPDWKAFQGGLPLPVRRAVGALLSVQVKQPGDVTFQFRPPWYYGFCMTACLVCWVGGIALLGVMRLRLLPASWRSAWYGDPAKPGEQEGMPNGE